MRFLRRDKDEPEPRRCEVCGELLPDDAQECQMCGHPAAGERQQGPPAAPTGPTRLDD